MTASSTAPAPRPCGSCPYRKDVPSGVWQPVEYAKLPGYDLPTPQQPPGLFLCHQQDGRVCAGWAGCHDGAHLLALRMAAVTGALSDADLNATIDYTTPVPLFESGAEAAEHGMRDVLDPGSKARRTINNLTRKREQRCE